MYIPFRLSRKHDRDIISDMVDVPERYRSQLIRNALRLWFEQNPPEKKLWEETPRQNVPPVSVSSLPASLQSVTLAALSVPHVVSTTEIVYHDEQPIMIDPITSDELAELGKL